MTDIVLITFFILFAVFAIWFWHVTRKESLSLFGNDDLAPTYAETQPVLTSPPASAYEPPLPSPPAAEPTRLGPPSDESVIPPPASAIPPTAETRILRRKPTSFAFLVARSGIHEGRAFQLSETTDIGRAANLNDIVLDDLSASRQHARLRFQNGNYILFDLASVNGTFVNDQRIQRRVLTDGDLVRIGETVLVFKQVKPISGSSGSDDSSEDYHFSCNVHGQVPSRMYEGDSSIIILTIIPQGLLAVPKPSKKYKFIEPLNFVSTHKIPKLEIELLAVGFDVSGERIQTKPLYRDQSTSFYWNICPPKSGTFEVGFVFRTEGKSRKMKEVGMFTTQINVTKYDGLTNSQARLMAAASGTVAAILGAAEILFKIGAFSIR